MEYSILMPGAVVEEGATVRYSIVAEKAVIAKGAEVGGSPSDSDADNWGVAVVAEGVRIGSGAKLAAKEMADEDLPSENRRRSCSGSRFRCCSALRSSSCTRWLTPSS